MFGPPPITAYLQIDQNINTNSVQVPVWNHVEGILGKLKDIGLLIKLIPSKIKSLFIFIQQVNLIGHQMTRVI